MTRMQRPRYQCAYIAAAGIAALLAGALSSAAQTTPSSSGSSVYRWVDEKGVVHYGDSVPAEFSQSERSVLNNQGVEIGHVEGTKGPAEQAARAEAEELARQHAQHDQFLLSTYVSSKDIEQLRDERVSQIDAQIKAATIYIDNLGVRLAALADRAMNFKPYSNDTAARRVPDDLAEDLVHTINEVRSQRRALDAKRREQIDTRSQFEGDIKRYRELTTKPRT
jgi:hypothetical protein